jgi:hypothetical protein
MRTVFIFPAGERAETVASLDRHLPQQRDPWILDRNLYIKIDDEQAGHLFSDWDPDDVAALKAAIGHHPAWAVQVDISGRIDGAGRSANSSHCCLSTEAWRLTTTLPMPGPFRKSSPGL